MESGKWGAGGDEGDEGDKGDELITNSQCPKKVKILLGNNAIC
jgi:hypothetical protein